MCAFELYDDVDYDTWYQTQLLRELQIHDPRSEVDIPSSITVRGCGLSRWVWLHKAHTSFIICRYKMVRHRVTWILGTWVTVKMSPQLRPSLYSVLVPLLAGNEDLAVRTFPFPFHYVLLLVPPPPPHTHTHMHIHTL